MHALTARVKKMADNKEFIIQIKGMQIGKHHYDFPIEGSFFKEFDNSLILDANLDAEVELEKGSGWINVTCSITGDVTVECDRCLDDLVIPMDFECTMAVKFAKSVENSDNDEFIIMDPTDGCHPEFFGRSIMSERPLRRSMADTMPGERRRRRVVILLRITSIIKNTTLMENYL